MSRYIPPSEILVQERIPRGGKGPVFLLRGTLKRGARMLRLWLSAVDNIQLSSAMLAHWLETASQHVVEAAGRRFLESIGLDGMAEVEFKFDRRDGKYKILDGNLRLGLACGLDNLRPNEISGMGRVLHRHGILVLLLLVVVFPILVADFARSLELNSGQVWPLLGPVESRRKACAR